MFTGSMFPGNSTYGGLDVFPLTMGPNSMADFNTRKNINPAIDEEEPAFNEEGADTQNETDKGKKGSVWQRVKWTDSMVRLLITAVSYLGEDAVSECGRRFANLQKKGKWKTVSKVMAERGLYVSPQQCEDKFNDLNKRYNKLNDILGRGTSCQVVENPGLLNMMDHLSDKVKDEVRKILSSKQLFYEEMCSYHNGNRLHLPHDPNLQRSLQLAVHNRVLDLDEDDHEAVETDEYEEKMKHGMEIEEISQEKWMKSRMVELEERKMQLEVQRLEMEKERFKWEKFSKKKEREMEKRKMENERSRLENERMVLELKKMEMSIFTNQ